MTGYPTCPNIANYCLKDVCINNRKIKYYMSCGDITDGAYITVILHSTLQ
jgi:hypothetical protein